MSAASRVPGGRDEPLIGMALLAGSCLVMDAVSGKEVLVEERQGSIP